MRRVRGLFKALESLWVADMAILTRRWTAQRTQQHWQRGNKAAAHKKLA